MKFVFSFVENNNRKGSGNINLIEDITSIVKDDNRHTVKIAIEPVQLSIYLSDDPDDDYEELYVIPIKYDILTQSAYIDDYEYKKMMTDNDGGIDLEEIKLIHEIMLYLEENKESIEDYMNKLSVTRNKSMIPETVI